MKYRKLSDGEIVDDSNLLPVERIDLDDKPKSSDTQAFFNSVKSFVGAGVLALPFGIKHSGLVLGMIGFTLIAIASNYTIRLLIRCAREHDDCKSYADVGYRAFGRWGTFIVNFSIISSQAGFCCAYLIFIGDNLNSIFPQISDKLFMLMILPVMIGLAWLRDLKYLAPTSIFALVSLSLAFVIVFYYGFKDFSEKSWDWFDWLNFPFFFGLAVFAFEGINLALPVYYSMQTPSHYGRVLDSSMVFVFILYSVFAVMGYLFFGEDTKDVITLNLPDSVLTDIVKVALVIELIPSYPIQLFPVTQIVENWLLSTRPETEWIGLKRNLIRLGLVLITAGIAVSIPLFGLFSNLVGAFSNSIAAFILPPVFYMKIFKGRLESYEIILNVLIVVLGIAASGVSSTLTIIEIAKKLS